MKTLAAIDGNEAAASVAYRCNELIAVYPITPASPMGEAADRWRAEGRPNIWGSVPGVIEMQSEGGAAGAIHGALQAGSLTTTFTASQGLLLMLPNMYKIAGELTPTVFHIAARAIATQALSIFGDHSDVMAARATGWAMLFSASVQEAMDMAAISHAATLEARVPFLHIFDGFRTSHEIQKIRVLQDEDLRAMIDDTLVRRHRDRSLSPDRPFIRGTAQNPDVFFQSREASNPFYAATPGIVQAAMDRFAELTGRRYRVFDYVGAEDAERVIVVMGSACETAEETVLRLAAHGKRVGLLKVRLYRPFSAEALVQALPETTRAIAVLDRTKEPGSSGEPLYQDVVTALSEAVADGNAPFIFMPRVIGGRYGIASKEFTPPMVEAVLHELMRLEPKKHFTVGIRDDVTQSSLEYDEDPVWEDPDTKRAVFWGLGSDGTVGANKNTIKIIAENTPLYAQGYFVYDSKKAGARTISHLRFGPNPIRSTYLIQRADFVAVHQFNFLEKFDTLAMAAEGATFLLNSPYPADEVWEYLPGHVREQIVAKRLRFFVVDAYTIAQETGMKRRINTIMQTCFFALSGVLEPEVALQHIRQATRATYGTQGEGVVTMNLAAIDRAVDAMEEVAVPLETDKAAPREAPVMDGASAFVRDVTATIMAGHGDHLPVSAMPVDGTYPSGTSRFEKRSLAPELPVWDEDLCIQCGKCVMVCPHAAIRATVVAPAALESAPEGFKTAPAAWREMPDMQYTLQVAVEDCTGCVLCVDICPAHDKQQPERKALEMVPAIEERRKGIPHWDFFRSLPGLHRSPLVPLRFTKAKDVQLLEPLFEFSGACSGCGETPYLTLLTRLFGDRALVANATGCSSIFGGNLPTTPWSMNREGRGPAWSNSLFEDNAEFGLGMRLAVDRQTAHARRLLEAMRTEIGDDLVAPLMAKDTSIDDRREAIDALRERLEGIDDPRARDLAGLAGNLVPRSVWIVGGDGWAYDIGFGGLDHVMASGANVNVLVMDTEVYSNTGGQASKATGLGAVARFAESGKSTPKKDLGMLAMQYGSVYVGQVSLGGDENHLIKTFHEAESYDGPSLVIAYGHCIEHGIDMTKGLQQQRLAVQSGYWPLYRHDPRRAHDGKNPFQLDSRKPTVSFRDYIAHENRYQSLIRREPEHAEALVTEAEAWLTARWNRLEGMAGGGV
jgi:pyruvate-ferredoxin/flavodoxin oxidoreductase